MNEASKIRIMQQCPRFERCSAPICPLDVDQDNRSYITGEPKCSLPKSKRIAIAQNTALPRQGMTGKEWSGMIHWNRKSEVEKLSKLAKLRQVSPFCDSNSELTSEGRGKVR